MQEYLNELRKVFIIKTKNHEEEFRIAEFIHNRLVGNQDYIDCEIVLNMSADRADGTVNEVHCYIFNDAKYNPPILDWLITSEGETILKSSRCDGVKTVIIDLQ